MKKALFLLVLTLFAAQAALAAQPAGSQATAAPQSRAVKELEKLNLSPEQTRSVAAILKASQPQSRTLAENAKQARQTLHAVMVKEPGDEAKVLAAYRAMTAAGEKVVLERAKVTAQVRAVLTPAQTAQFEKSLSDMAEGVAKRGDRSRAALDAWIEQNSK